MIEGCKNHFDKVNQEIEDIKDRVRQLENVISAMSEKLNEVIDHINESEEEEEND